VLLFLDGCSEWYVSVVFLTGQVLGNWIAWGSRPDEGNRQFLVMGISWSRDPLLFQHHIHGWSGLIMDLALYQLLKPIAFVRPVSLGDSPVYPAFTPPAAIKSINNVFKRSRKCYFSYIISIEHAFECSTRQFLTMTRSRTTQISRDGTHRCPSVPSSTSSGKTAACPTQ
jgi:hypothetical protein